MTLTAKCSAYKSNRTGQRGALGEAHFPWKCELGAGSHSSDMLVGSLHSVACKELMVKHRYAENRGSPELTLSLYLILML